MDIGDSAIDTSRTPFMKRPQGRLLWIGRAFAGSAGLHFAVPA